MNRWLSIPAACCLIAFALLYAALHGAFGGEEATQKTIRTEPVAYTSRREIPPDASLLSTAEANRTLVALRDAYLRPWRQWETAPYRMYSRIAPKPIPSISAEIQLASESLGETDGSLVGIISIRKGTETRAVPCVVDRLAGRVRLFDNGKWLTGDEWLTTAPIP